jgi:hypothetical protein
MADFHNGDEYEYDAAMNIDTDAMDINEVLESEQDDGDESETDVIALHHDAERKYEIKTKKIRQKIALVASLHSI